MIVILVFTPKNKKKNNLQEISENWSNSCNDEDNDDNDNDDDDGEAPGGVDRRA